MRRVHLALVLAALMPAAARAEPVTVNLSTSEGGFTQTGDITYGQTSIDLGTVELPTVNSVGLLAFQGLHVWSNYTVSLALEGLGAWDTLRLEILDPLDDDDGLDPANQPSYVPAGFSTSNDLDGFSFAQDAALQRAAVFAGGSAKLTADEKTHRGDILLFSGLGDADTARVTFGLRDSAGDREFLIRFSASGEGRFAAGTPALHQPEPATMLLLGTGLVGLAGVIRRRTRAAGDKGK